MFLYSRSFWSFFNANVEAPKERWIFWFPSFCTLKTFPHATSSGARLWKIWKQWSNVFQVICCSFYVLFSFRPAGQNLGSTLEWERDQRVVQDLGSSLKAVLVSPSVNMFSGQWAYLGLPDPETALSKQGYPTFWHLWATLEEELSWATH